MIRLSCPDCKTTLTCSPDEAGATLACPECKRQLTVPSLAESTGQAASLTPAPFQSASQWFYVHNQQRIGPIPLDVLRQLAACGQLQPHDIVLQLGTETWLQASSVQEISFPQAAATSSQPAPPLPIPDGKQESISAKPQPLAKTEGAISAAAISSSTIPTRMGVSEGTEGAIPISIPRNSFQAKLPWILAGGSLGVAVLVIVIALAGGFSNRTPQMAETPGKDKADPSKWTESSGSSGDAGQKKDLAGDHTEPSKRDNPGKHDPAKGQIDPPKGEGPGRKDPVKGETGPTTNDRPGQDTLPNVISKMPEKGSVRESQLSGTSIVFAEGIGTTQDEALKDAFRTAVKRVVGVFVDSETLIKNDEIISDKVLTFSDGAIKKYEELDKSESNGLFRVRIMAAVERRTVAARLEAAHISVKAVDVKNVAESFSKEIQADLDRLAKEFTEKEAKENAIKLLENDLARIAKLNLIEAKVFGQPERGERSGDKLPLKITVHYNFNKSAFYAAMSKLEKSLLMNSTAAGKITFLATPDPMYIKRENQSSIKENIGDNDVILVNSGLAKETWRSHWNYYIISKRAGDLYRKMLCDKPIPRIKLSLLDKDAQAIATDEFGTSSIVNAFRSFAFDLLPLDVVFVDKMIAGKMRPWLTNEAEEKMKKHKGLGIQPELHLRRAAEWTKKTFPEGLPLQHPEKIPRPQIEAAASAGIVDSSHVALKYIVTAYSFDYTTSPLNRKCYFASPLFFNYRYGNEIHYTLAAGDVRSIPLTLAEVNLIQSVKCEVY